MVEFYWSAFFPISSVYIPTDITVDAENQLIEWFGLPIIFSNLLHHYETKLSGLPKACEQGSEFNLPITQQEIGKSCFFLFVGKHLIGYG